MVTTVSVPMTSLVYVSVHSVITLSVLGRVMGMLVTTVPVPMPVCAVTLLPHLVRLRQGDGSVGQLGQDGVSARVSHTTKRRGFVQKGRQLRQASRKLETQNGLADSVKKKRYK